MIYTLLVLLFGLAFLSQGRHRGAARGLAFLSVMLYLVCATGWLPQRMLDGLGHGLRGERALDWRGQPPIVVLGAGNAARFEGEPVVPSVAAYSRIAIGASLYRQCQAHSAAPGACRVVISGGDPQRRGVSEADVYAGLLERLGVPRQALQVESHSLNTFQNAQRVAALLHPAPEQRRIVLVTSNFHMRRAIQDFVHAGFEPAAVVSDRFQTQVGLKTLDWNIAMTDTALIEYLGLLRYHLYVALGIYPPKAR